MPLTWLREFLRLEAASGIILMFAAAAALLFANSPLGAYYVEFLQIPGSVQLGSLEVSKPLLLWVNDLWMAVFFFLIDIHSCGGAVVQWFFGCDWPHECISMGRRRGGGRSEEDIYQSQALFENGKLVQWKS